MDSYALKKLASAVITTESSAAANLQWKIHTATGIGDGGRKNVATTQDTRTAGNG
jgi:hypothetical protein